MHLLGKDKIRAVLSATPRTKLKSMVHDFDLFASREPHWNTHHRKSYATAGNHLGVLESTHGRSHTLGRHSGSTTARAEASRRPRKERFCGSQIDAVLDPTPALDDLSAVYDQQITDHRRIPKAAAEDCDRNALTRSTHRPGLAAGRWNEIVRSSQSKWRSKRRGRLGDRSPQNSQLPESCIEKVENKKPEKVTSHFS
jgi:hypothetical protein